MSVTEAGHREPYLDAILARLNADLRTDEEVGLAYRAQLLPLLLQPNSRGFVLTRTDDNIVLHGTAEADPGPESPERAELMLASAAYVIQEGVLEEIDRAWPKCPNHQHPLVPDVAEGTAVWRCPSADSDRWRIGDLPKTTVG